MKIYRKILNKDIPILPYLTNFLLSKYRATYKYFVYGDIRYEQARSWPISDWTAISSALLQKWFVLMYSCLQSNKSRDGENIRFPYTPKILQFKSRNRSRKNKPKNLHFPIANSCYITQDTSFLPLTAWIFFYWYRVYCLLMITVFIIRFHFVIELTDNICIYLLLSVYLTRFQF
jgi:hypothetical protein